MLYSCMVKNEKVQKIQLLKRDKCVSLLSSLLKPKKKKNKPIDCRQAASHEITYMSLELGVNQKSTDLHLICDKQKKRKGTILVLTIILIPVIAKIHEAELAF